MPKSSKNAGKPTIPKKDKPPKPVAANSKSDEWVKITLRTDQGYAISFRSNRKLQEVAMKWRAVVRNRSLWTGNLEKREERARLASEDVKDALKSSLLKSPEIVALKDTLKNGQEGAPEEVEKRIDEDVAKQIEADIEAAIAELAKARIIEVSIPFIKEKIGWEARVLPWEYLITAATSAKRQGQPLTIIRHLDCSRTPGGRTPESLLMVVSAPGKVRETSNFGAERDMVSAALGLKGERSLNDSPVEVSDKIRQLSPDIVHLAGVDTHQGVSLKIWTPPERKAEKKAREMMAEEEQETAENVRQSKASLTDGFLMKGTNEQIEAVSAETLSKILNLGDSGGHSKQPLLVSCNIYHSAARIGPMIVAGGADAAIGFQDEFDEALAELFFGNFYHAWRTSKWDLLAAFVMACQMLRAQPRGLSGTGVVLWTAQSFLQSSVEKNEAFKLPELGDLELAMRREKANVIKPNDAEFANDEAAARNLLPVEIEPSATINYSMLHNERPLFKKFLIHKWHVRAVNHVEVDVALQVGDQKAEYSASWDVMDSPLDLRDKIRLPLLSKAWAEIGESARTTLSVQLRWGNHELYRQTHPVTLLTLDEWRDDDVNTAWLPSFVLPRDPAVRRIIESGQRYLMALRDDPVAGFDGYQSLIDGADDPEDIAEDLDYQVRAIWSAIVYDHSVSYTNPPPSFTERSQRLRSPSEIFDAKRATCIDTTLLLASCLELIEVYPVLFLLTGHAFVGYWRSDSYRQEFMEQMAEFGSNLKSSGGWESDPYKPSYAWYFEKRFYDIVLEYIREAKLVPLESTLLTTRGSYGDAIAQGMDNLRNRSEFHSMLDVVTAHENRVTPIPMRGR
ncbi:MAG: hypothetical protein SF097_19895 [Acidobacteriota bacterium]|nr:hypothetical protein [Acidobacteriota bacterium]